MPRFYCPQPLASGATIDLPEAVAHHLHVVRMQPGDPLVLFNGAGGQFATAHDAAPGDAKRAEQADKAESVTF